MALTVAIVGAGPSGMYAAEALAADPEVRIDIFDRLPVPTGLVRYGVAPDHLSIRGVRDTLDKVFDHPNVRFFGNVDIGPDISLEQLRQAYHAVVLTYGASRDRALGVAGEDLAGSIAATDFVAWYTGHPDHPADEFADFLRQAHSVAVVGVGNVAVDVTRILTKSPTELATTDMPLHVIEALSESHVRDVHVLGRRGPLQATFTTKELRELGELSDVDVLVDPLDLDRDLPSNGEEGVNKVAARNLEVLREWSQRPIQGKARRIHFHFFARPREIDGNDRVEGLVIQRTALDSSGMMIDVDGETSRIDVDAVIRSVGYRGVPLDDVPFDEVRGVVRHVDGRVINEPGLYVAGWIKRGPSGIIGTNKKDAAATVQSLLADAESLQAPTVRIEDLLGDHRVVNTQGWRAINRAELVEGELHGRERLTLHTRNALLAASVTAVAHQ